MTEKSCGKSENDRENVQKARDKEDVNRDKDPEKGRFQIGT